MHGRIYLMGEYFDTPLVACACDAQNISSHRVCRCESWNKVICSWFLVHMLDEIVVMKHDIAIILIDRKN